MIGSLGKYRLDARLGGGGMAEVFLGSAVGIEGFSRKVAIKRVLPGFSENPAFAQMFVDEAQISSRLVHPNIVSVLDFDKDPEQRLFLVMELVEGRDLDSLVGTGVLPLPVVIYVIAEVLRGLGYAHDLPVNTDIRGVVHRDVSPHNVLLSWEGAVKVSDFGIAKARAASAATASLFIKGKPAYMSPEQANGERLDGRSDLFAVGIMLWEMLVGRRLFVAEDTRSTLAAVLFGQIPRPRSLRAEVPKDVERVCMKLLERDLPARYATAELAVADLLSCAAAPRDGRAELVRALAERFPDQAQVRGSLARLRGNTPPGVQTPVPTYERSTIADGAAGRPSSPPNVGVALPSLGAARGAETGTLPPHAASTLRRRRGPAIALLAGGFAVAALAAFAIVSLATGGHGGSTPGSPGSSSITAPPAGSAAVATVAPPTPPDASVAPVPARPASPADANVAQAAAAEPKKDASSIQPAHPGPEKRTGKLAVKAFPVLTVYVDKKSYGDTPVTIPLVIGKHTVRLVNIEAHRDETVAVTIKDNDTTTIDRE